MTRHRWTVRVRLTALYGGLFLVAGAALLAITYVLLAQALTGQQVDATMVLSAPSTPAVALHDVVPAVPATLDTSVQRRCRPG